MRPVGWGIVGFGWVAQDFAVPAIVAAGHRLVAVHDTGSVAADAARRSGARWYDTQDALLADPTVDAVYVATPNWAHGPVVAAAAAAGKPVLCEKPMAATLDQAENMAAAVSRAGVLYGTAFDQRHHPAHRAIRAALQAGRVGRVTAIRITYACWLPPDWSPTGAADNWRIDQARAGGGALMDLAPHGIDLTDFLLDEPIRLVTAMTQRRVHDYPVDDGAVVIGSTASGILVSLSVAYNHPDALPRRRLEIVGTAGMIVAENTMGQDAGGRVTCLDARTGSQTDLAVPDLDVSPFTRQMAAFSDAVRGAAHTFDAARDLHTMRLLHQCYESAACP